MRSTTPRAWTASRTRVHQPSYRPGPVASGAVNAPSFILFEEKAGRRRIERLCVEAWGQPPLAGEGLVALASRITFAPAKARIYTFLGITADRSCRALRA